MHERLIDALRQDRNQFPAGVPDSCEQKRGMKVELLPGGFRLPGFLEYHAGDDQVTFTVKRLSRSTPGEV